MERLHLSPENVTRVAQNAAAVLQMGDVVLYPTDTLYGLGADAFSNEAVDKIYAIKGRDEGKPTHALVRDLEMAERFCEITADVRLLSARLPKGKVTFICKKKTGIETGVCRGIDTFGFRIPDNDFCLSMIEQFGGPITATSANRSGSVPQRTVDAILEQFSYSSILHASGHKQNTRIGLVVDGGELPASQPSTVVSCVGDHPVMLREGAVSAADLASALQATDQTQA